VVWPSARVSPSDASDIGQQMALAQHRGAGPTVPAGCRRVPTAVCPQARGTCVSHSVQPRAPHLEAGGALGTQTKRRPGCGARERVCRTQPSLCVGNTIGPSSSSTVAGGLGVILSGDTQWWRGGGGMMGCVWVQLGGGGGDGVCVGTAQWWWR